MCPAANKQLNCLVLPNDPLSIYENQGGLPYFLDRFVYYSNNLGKVWIYNQDFGKIKSLQSNIKIVNMPKPKLKILEVLYRIINAYDLCKKYDVDFIRVLEGGTFVKSFAAGLVGKLTGKPVVVSVHGVYNFFGSYMGFKWYHNMVFRLLKWLSGKLASITFVVDDSQAKELKGWKNVFIIPNYIDDHIFKPKRAKKVYDAIYVGSLIKKKGIDVLLDAFKLVKKQKPNFNLAILGSGDVEIPKLQGLYYPGAIPHNKIASYYHKSNFFVTASHDESFCIPVIEAEACGLPVVATNLAPFERNTIKNVTSKLSPIGDSHSLAKNMLFMLNNKANMRKMGLAAQEFARKNFSKTNVLKREVELVRSLQIAAL